MKNNIKLKIILISAILFFSIFGLAKSSQAATISVVDLSNNPSCAQGDVQRIINDVNTHDGDTVVIPAGSCTWTSGVLVTTKSINISGTGNYETIITHAIADASNYHKGLFVFGGNGKSFRVTNIKFTNSSTVNSNIPAIDVYGNPVNWRVDHILLDEGGGNTCSALVRLDYSDSYGLIDHNTIKFTNCNNLPTGVADYGNNTLAAWNSTVQFGSANAVFIEDNLFDFDKKYDSAIQAASGAQYVFRHNTVYNVGVDMHGADSNGFGSGHWMEIYNNNFICNLTLCGGMVANIRGGTAILHDNIATGNWNNFTGIPALTLQYARSCFNGDECTIFNTPLNPSWGNCVVNQNALPNRFNRCDGTKLIDKNTTGQYGWPCFQQPGTAGDGMGSYKSEPVYAWGNTITNAGTTIPLNVGVRTGGWCQNVKTLPDVTTHIQENRDFFNAVKPGYVSYMYPHPLAVILDITPPASPTGLSVS